MFNRPFVRCFATLKDIQLRLKSVKNIEKITKSMKMIAGTKLSKAQKALDAAKAFSQGALASQESMQIERQTQPKTYILCSSDRGLCGAIHSSLVKSLKNTLTQPSEGKTPVENAKIVVLGEKAKVIVARELKKNILYSFANIGRATPTFWEACAIVQVLANDAKAEEGALSQEAAPCIVFNKFISVLAYESCYRPVYSVQEFLAAKNLKAFEFAEEQMENYALFQATCSLYGALVEGHVAEMAAKRTSMDNATKNAGEIIGKLTMTYNRTRQSVITNELVDIITGAAAL